jgi:hypothetical protein
MDVAAYEAHYAAERHAMRVEQDKQGREEMRASADRTLNGVRSHVHTFVRSDVTCDGCGGYYEDVLPADKPVVVHASAESAVARYRARYA